MTNTSYTPWASMPMQRGAHLGARVYATDTEVLIAEIYDAKHGPMIAAAPEMAEALERIEALTDPRKHAVHSVTEARQWVRQSNDVARTILARIKGE